MAHDTMKLAKFLKQQREKSNLSQSDIAEKLGYSTPQFISNWERGLSIPPIPVLKKISYYYGIDANELFDICLAFKIDEVKKELKRKFNEL